MNEQTRMNEQTKAFPLCNISNVTVVSLDYNSPENCSLLLMIPLSNRGSEKHNREEKNGKQGAQNEALTHGKNWSSEISVDWVTFCCHESRGKNLLELIFDTFGIENGETGFDVMGSQSGYELAYQHSELGLYFALGHSFPEAGCMVCVQGRACQSLGFDGVARLISEAKSSKILSRVTRLDIALDFFGDVKTAIDKAIKDCQGGRLCRVKSWHPDVRYSGTEVVGETLYLGSRASERFVRFYDKGLETKTCQRGEWVRWEASFKGKTSDILSGARDVGETNSLSFYSRGHVNSETVLEYLAGQALQVAEFREQGNGSNIERRKKVPWFRRLVERCTSGNLQPRVKVRKSPEAVETEKWVSQVVLPKLKAFAECAGVALDDVLDYFNSSKVGDVSKPSDREIVKGIRESIEVKQEKIVPF